MKPSLLADTHFCVPAGAAGACARPRRAQHQHPALADGAAQTKQIEWPDELIS